METEVKKPEYNRTIDRNISARYCQDGMHGVFNYVWDWCATVYKHHIFQLNKQHKAALNTMASVVDVYEQKYNNLRDSVDAAKVKMDAKIDDISGMINKLDDIFEAELQAEIMKYVELRDKYDQSNAEYVKLDKEMLEVERVNEDLRERLTDAVDQRDKYFDELKLMKADFRKTCDQNQQLRSELDAKEDLGAIDVLGWYHEAQDLRNKEKERESMVIELEAQIERQATMMKRMGTINGQLQHEKNKLEARAKELEEHTAQFDIGKLRERIMKLEVDLLMIKGKGKFQQNVCTDAEEN